MSTEQAILNAAERLFCEKGYALTTTVEIARLAGCNQPTVHYYFRTKDRLFEAIFENKAALFLSSFRAIEEKALPFEEMLRGCVQAHFDILRANPRLPFLLFNELLTNPGRIGALKAKIAPVVANIYSGFDAALKREAAKGNIRPTGVVDLMFSVIALNASVFLASPIFRQGLLMSDDEMSKFISARRDENIRIVLASLRPTDTSYRN